MTDRLACSSVAISVRFIAEKSSAVACRPGKGRHAAQGPLQRFYRAGPITEGRHIWFHNVADRGRRGAIYSTRMTSTDCLVSCDPEVRKTTTMGEISE